MTDAADATADAPSRRIVGVDVARGLALVLMMAAHIVPSDSTGAIGAVHDLSGGRASALFAVVAGLSLALVTGRGEPRSGADLRVARLSVCGRAFAIAGIGLSLGVFRSGVAVILVNYAALFVVASLFLGLRRRALTGWAAGWLLVSPLLGHVVRPAFAQGPGPVPSWFSLAAPGEFLANLFLTGYYPVLQWTGYLLVGLAVGRSGATSSSAPASRVAAQWLLAVGAMLAAGAKILSSVALDGLGGRERLVIPPESPVAGQPLDEVLTSSLYGTTPTTSWWWQAASGPHEGSLLDLAHTTGTALLALGLCLLVVPLVPRSRLGSRVLFPLASAGSMTLTLYCLHVVALGVALSEPGLPQANALPGPVWVTHVVVALFVATAWKLAARRMGLSGRGPVEQVATSTGRSLADAGRA